MLNGQFAEHRFPIARMVYPRAVLAASGVFASLAIWLVASSVQAVELNGIGQPAAIDQPQVYMSLHTTPGGAPIVGQTTGIFGDIESTIGIQAYLDTGASGILVSPQTKGAWHLTDSMYNGQPVNFEDTGVVGTAPFTVSTPIYAKIAPFTPDADPEDQSKYEPVNEPAAVGKPWTPLRIQMGKGADPGSPADDLDIFGTTDINVVGMPAMKGKMVLIDARQSNIAMKQIAQAEQSGGQNGAFESFLNNIDNISLKTYVYDPANAPPVAGTANTNLHVQMSYADFSNFTITTPTGAPGPTLTHNPFIGPNPLASIPGNPFSIPADNTPKVKLSFGGQSTQGSFLLDTGAGASFVSQNIAGQLHVRYVAGTEDTDNPVLEQYTPNASLPRFAGDKYPGTSAGSVDQFKVTVGGIGGDSKTVAGFYLDSMLVRTKEGNSAYDNDPRHLFYKDDPATGKSGAAVLVLDINVSDGTHNVTLDGDFGVNMLAGSLLFSFSGLSDFTIANFTAGAFDWMNFDEKNNVLGLQLNSAFHMKGDFNLDGYINNSDIQAMLNALADLNGYKTGNSLSDADLLTIADINSDGVVNSADLSPYLKFLAGGQLPGSIVGVPEPAACVLAIFGALGVAVQYRRRRQSRILI
jgi:hypothetical protein